MSKFLRKPHQMASGKGAGLSSCIRLSHRYASSWLSTAAKEQSINATKAMLGIANELADAFPPLKSCLGGINALIMHYNVGSSRIAPRSCWSVHLRKAKTLKRNLETLSHGLSNWRTAWWHPTLTIVMRKGKGLRNWWDLYHILVSLMVRADCLS